MKQIKLLLLVLLFTVIPKSLWAYTKDQIVSFDNKVTSYKVLVPSGAHPTLMFIGTTKSGHLEIPSTINDGSGITFTVTEIGSEVSYNCANVTSVHLPNTIEKLGNAIFSDAKFTKINIPKSVKYIDNTAWITLSAVPECKVDPENAVFQSDENGVLYTNNKHTLCSVPSSIVTQKNSDTYTVDPSVTSIRKAAFSSNPGLKKIILPPNLNSVEEGWPSIASTSHLEAFDIASGGQTKFEVKDGVLFNKEHNKLVVYPHGKKNVTEYKIPDGVKEIASYAIADNSALTSIDLNEVTKLNISCLVRIPKLKKITLPKNLEKNGLMSGAIEGCFTLEAYEIAKENKDFATENGVLFSKNKETLYFYPIGKTDSSYEIPSTVKTIDVKSFQGASKLTSLVIPESVERIEEQAFRQNYALTSVTFREPSRINHLNAYSFWQCSKLTEVTLPSSITKIGKVFLQCDKLEKVNVPAGSKLETIEEGAFSSNKNLKSFNFLGSCPLKTIETNAFANLKNIETFNFPKAVINIKRNAFSGCSNLATVNFDPEAEIKEIGAGAFADCGLHNIEIPKNVTKIDKEAFRNCSALTKIDVTASTTSIHPLAFQFCTKLDDIHVSKDNTVYSSVDGYLLTKDKKTLVIFPPGKVNSNFTLLPPSIEKIGEYAFYACSKLTNITIPNKVTFIGQRAFGLCDNLKVITFLCDKIISKDSINVAPNAMSFDDGTQTEGKKIFDKATINVRKNLLEEYKNHDFFKKFTSIKPSFDVQTEEYIAMSEDVVNMLNTTCKDHTFVLPTTVEHESKTYKVKVLGDYAFQNAKDGIKEVVVKRDLEYIGAQAFVTDITKRESTVKRVFFIESKPTAKMLSTTRFELDETGTDYNEFAKDTKIYVKKSALEKYKKEWKKQVYNTTTHSSEDSKFNFIGQLDYKIPGVTLTHKYGTFAREFDVDFGVYKEDKKDNTDIAAFVAAKNGVTEHTGDYGNTEFHVRMTSIDENGGYTSYSYVPANTGVLLKVLNSNTTPNDFYYAIGEHDNTPYTVKDNIMTGVVVNPKEVVVTESSPIFVMHEGIFKKVKKTLKFPIHKAYAKLPSLPVGASLTFVFSDDNTITGINTVEAENNKDNVYYNLNGQRVTNPQHGVFIHGGRKVIIK